MSPTWRRGTTLVGHPAVFRGMGSPGRYEAAERPGLPRQPY
jgi:hypothetical protein